MLSHTNMVINALMESVSGDFGPPLDGFTAAPMFHIADCAGLFGVSQVGGSHFFIPGFVPKLFLKQ